VSVDSKSDEFVPPHP